MDSQDRLMIKAPKKTPLFLRAVLLLLATVSGVYICSICLRQLSPITKPAKLNIQLSQSNTELRDIPQPEPLIVTKAQLPASVITNEQLPQSLLDTKQAKLKVDHRGPVSPMLVKTTEPVSLRTVSGGLLPPIAVGSTERVIRRSRERNTYGNFRELDNNEVVCDKSSIEPWEVPYVHYPRPRTYDRKECACNPVRYFAIVSLQRSGSRWFETLLNNHTNVSSYGEIFKIRNGKNNISSMLQSVDKLYNLDWLNEASRNECSAAIGFKWMLNQGLMEHHNMIADYLKKKGASILFLFRRNMLRRMISHLANQYDGEVKSLNQKHRAHVKSSAEAQVLARYKPALGTKHLITTFKREESIIKTAIEYFKSVRHIVLYYEDLIQNRTKLRDVQEFLRLPYRELQSRHVKIHVGSVSDQVRNFDKVQKALKGSAYERFLHLDY